MSMCTDAVLMHAESKCLVMEEVGLEVKDMLVAVKVAEKNL